MSIQTTDAGHDDGAKIRIPLDHPETDAIHFRASVLLGAGILNDREFGTLLKKIRELRRVDFKLARRLCGRPLPWTDCRPELPAEALMPASPHFGKREVEVWTGWVRRVADYVAALEMKYFGAAEVENDDI